MPKSVNKAILLGHVDEDPEIRSTNGGTLSTAPPRSSATMSEKVRKS